MNVTEQARLVEAIAGGSDIAALTTALKEREQRRAYLQHELDAVDAGEHLKAFDSAATARELRRRVEEWHGLVQRNTPIARQVLDRLLTDRICWTPRRDDGIYEYRGRLHYDRLLAGIVATEKRRNGEARGSLRKVWRPQREREIRTNPDTEKRTSCRSAARFTRLRSARRRTQPLVARGTAPLSRRDAAARWPLRDVADMNPEAELMRR